MSTVTFENKITHSLAATGYTKLIPTEGREYCTLEIVGPTGTPDHVGTWTFCLTNDTAETAPEAIADISAAWTSGSPLKDIVQIKCRGAQYIAALYTRSSGGAGLSATIKVSFSKG